MDVKTLVLYLCINNQVKNISLSLQLKYVATNVPYVLCRRQSVERCAHGLLPGFPGLQPAHPLLKTICSNIWSSAPEDVHNDD
jgi:hypothetical protein